MKNQILKQLKSNEPSLKSISLERCSIDDEFVVSLADGLKANTTVEMLFLNNNNIRDIGVIAIAEALELNKSLCWIKLDGNQIGNEGIKALAAAIKNNNSIFRLELGWNNIGDEGAIALANSFQTNKKLQTFHLERNKIGNKGVGAIAKALEFNTTLQEVNLWGNSIPYADQTKINLFLNRNQYIKFYPKLVDIINTVVFNELLENKSHFYAPHSLLILSGITIVNAKVQISIAQLPEEIKSLIDDLKSLKSSFSNDLNINLIPLQNIATSLYDIESVSSPPKKLCL